MNKIKQISVVLFVISITIFISVLGCDQSEIPKEDILANIPSDIRSQVRRLYSSDPIQRALGANCLGKMGAEAVPAVPFLIGILDDETALEWRHGKNIPARGTSPAEEAENALEEIGKPAVDPLIAALKNQNSDIRGRAARALGTIRDTRAVDPLIAALKDENSGVRGRAARALQEITGKMFRQNQVKWQDWWDKNKDEILKSR